MGNYSHPLEQIFSFEGEEFMDRIFAYSIIYFREEMNITQTCAARLAGIDQSQLSRIEHGESWPNRSSLNEICRGMKISGKKFFNNMGEHLIYVAKRDEIFFPYEEEL